MTLIYAFMSFDAWWRSQPVENDDTWDELHAQAPYPRQTLNREDH